MHVIINNFMSMARLENLIITSTVKATSAVGLLYIVYISQIVTFSLNKKVVIRPIYSCYVLNRLFHCRWHSNLIVLYVYTCVCVCVCK